MLHPPRGSPGVRANPPLVRSLGSRGVLARVLLTAGYSAPVPIRDDEVEIAIEGKTRAGQVIAPDNVDSLALLELASAYVETLTALGNLDGAQMDFTGIEVRPGSAVLACRTHMAESVRLATDELSQRLARPVEETSPPSGVIGPLRRLREAVRALPKEQHARVSVGLNWRRELVVPTEEPPGPLVSMTTMRATPIRIGGVTPSIRFKAESEPEDFTLGVGIEVARNAGGHLYREVEIVAEIHRGWDGAIWDGELLEVREIQEVDAGEAWRSWFQRCLREWDDVDDVDAKLRQDGGGDGE